MMANGVVFSGDWNSLRLAACLWAAAATVGFAQDIRQPGRPAAGAQGQTQVRGQAQGQVNGQVQTRQSTQVGQPGQPNQTGQAPRNPANPANPAAQRPAAHQGAPGNAMGRAVQPTWFPLPAAHQELIDRVLQHWEKRSAKVNTYQCEFKRWKYDPVFLPPDPETGKEFPQEFSTGMIRYAAPDKAMYKDTKTQVYDVTKKAYKALDDGAGHHWICDGATIIEMVASNKQMVKTHLPPNMRGEALRTQGPLPFLFGAKADEIKQRYWVRMLNPPANVKDRYYLEAYPKRQADAANYQKVLIILDTAMYLPVNLVVYNVNYTPRNPARTSYEFAKRTDNPFDIRKFNPWAKDFFQPPVPKGWKVVNQQLGGGPAVAQRGQPAK